MRHWHRESFIAVQYGDRDRDRDRWRSSGMGDGPKMRRFLFETSRHHRILQFDCIIEQKFCQNRRKEGPLMDAGD